MTKAMCGKYLSLSLRLVPLVLAVPLCGSQTPSHGSRSGFPGVKDVKLDAANPAQDSKHLELFANGYFPALHGYFFLDEHDHLHVYRALPSVPVFGSQGLELKPEDNELKPKWKGEPYYHEVYVLSEGEWVPKMWGSMDTRGKREFSKEPERYLKFASCDRNDALTIPREDLSRLPWSEVKIKDAIEFEGYAAVVYSANPAAPQGPPCKQGEHPVWLDLLRKTRTGWKSVSSKTQPVSKGNYCGSKTLVSVRGGELRTILLLFFAEGDYNVAYSYVADDDADRNFLPGNHSLPDQ